MRVPQMVVCAANRLSDGTLLIGVRHWDQFMSEHLDMIVGSSTGECDEISFIKDHEQGFIDQRGNFLTRAEAWDVARIANQIVFTAPGCDGPELYSENLY